jgi:putative SOS response-associated peptidase YedK
MCGRFTLTIDAALLAEVFSLEIAPEHRPRFNVAPTQDHPIIRRDATGGTTATPMRWGLVPSWAKDASVGNRMINARAETAGSKPSFRAAAKQRRCLVPADGFYEWVATDSGKQPVHIRRPDRRPFALAGLWEQWDGTDERPLLSFTILTTEAMPPLTGVHHRMPVIVAEDRWAEWMAPDIMPPDRFGAFTAPSLPFDLEGQPVSRTVNRPGNDDPSVLEPAAGEDLPGF